jgi:hypothetical protein
MPRKSEPQPGDILIVSALQRVHYKKDKPIRHFLEKKVYKPASTLFQGHFVHAGIFTGEDRIVEGLAKGFKASSFKQATRGKDYVIIRPKVSKRSRKKAAAFAEQQLGKPYSETHLLGAAASVFQPKAVRQAISRVLGSKTRERKAYQCAGMVASAYAHAGEALDPTTHPIVTAPVSLLANGEVDVVDVQLKRPSTRPLQMPYFSRTRARFSEKIKVSEVSGVGLAGALAGGLAADMLITDPLMRPVYRRIGNKALLPGLVASTVIGAPFAFAGERAAEEIYRAVTRKKKKRKPGQTMKKQANTSTAALLTGMAIAASIGAVSADNPGHGAAGGIIGNVLGGTLGALGGATAGAAATLPFAALAREPLISGAGAVVGGRLGGAVGGIYGAYKGGKHFGKTKKAEESRMTTEDQIVSAFHAELDKIAMSTRSKMMLAGAAGMAAGLPIGGVVGYKREQNRLSPQEQKVVRQAMAQAYRQGNMAMYNRFKRMASQKQQPAK